MSRQVGAFTMSPICSHVHQRDNPTISIAQSDHLGFAHRAPASSAACGAALLRNTMPPHAPEPSGVLFFFFFFFWFCAPTPCQGRGHIVSAQPLRNWGRCLFVILGERHNSLERIEAGLRVPVHRGGDAFSGPASMSWMAFMSAAVSVFMPRASPCFSDRKTRDVPRMSSAVLSTAIDSSRRKPEDIIAAGTSGIGAFSLRLRAIVLSQWPSRPCRPRTARRPGHIPHAPGEFRISVSLIFRSRVNAVAWLFCSNLLLSLRSAFCDMVALHGSAVR